jgi:hypothetical protein
MGIGGVTGWLAHLASPWEWRSRRSVVALVAASVVLGGAGVAQAVARGPGRSWPSRVVVGLVEVAFVWLVAIRPALRSLRRWDRRHRTSASPPR